MNKLDARTEAYQQREAAYAALADAEAAYQAALRDEATGKRAEGAALKARDARDAAAHEAEKADALVTVREEEFAAANEAADMKRCEEAAAQFRGLVTGLVETPAAATLTKLLGELSTMQDHNRQAAEVLSTHNQLAAKLGRDPLRVPYDRPGDAVHGFPVRLVVDAEQWAILQAMIVKDGTSAPGLKVKSG